MKYFDFHTHVILKQLFADVPNIDLEFKRSDIIGVIANFTDLPNVIGTQCNHVQLSNFGDEVIVGIGLHAVEKFMAQEVLPLRRALTANGKFKVSDTVLTNIESNKLKAFTNFIMERMLDGFFKNPSFNILKKGNVKQPLPVNKVNVFFSVEGCHSLVDSVNEFVPGVSKYKPKEILDNLDKLLSKVNVLSVNLTHLQQSNLCNHAFGMQIANPKKFFPRGFGLGADGIEVIKGIFNRGICLDLKHMSYKARLDFRTKYDNGDFANAQPVVCTHAGFTGVSFSSWRNVIKGFAKQGDVVYLETVKTFQAHNNVTRPAPTFNSTTINLFDEEIVWIVRNEGIIGLSMDRRILGYVDLNDTKILGDLLNEEEFIVDKEFVSKIEWDTFGIKANNISGIVDADVCMVKDELEDATQGNVSLRNHYFYEHIFLHIKHYFQVCLDAGIAFEDAQKCICIGSDYDGLINPFIHLETVVQMDDLKRYIKQNFKDYLEDLDDASQWVDELDMDEFVDDLFYNNGLAFIKTRF